MHLTTNLRGAHMEAPFALSGCQGRIWRRFQLTGGGALRCGGVGAARANHMLVLCASPLPWCDWNTDSAVWLYVRLHHI